MATGYKHTVICWLLRCFIGCCVCSLIGIPSSNMLLVACSPHCLASLPPHPSLVWDGYNTQPVVAQAIVIMPTTISYQENNELCSLMMLTVEIINYAICPCSHHKIIVFHFLPRPITLHSLQFMLLLIILALMKKKKPQSKIILYFELYFPYSQVVPGQSGTRRVHVNIYDNYWLLISPW